MQQNDLCRLRQVTASELEVTMAADIANRPAAHRSLAAIDDKYCGSAERFAIIAAARSGGRTAKGRVSLRSSTTFLGPCWAPVCSRAIADGFLYFADHLALSSLASDPPLLPPL